MATIIKYQEHFYDKRGTLITMSNLRYKIRSENERYGFVVNESEYQLKDTLYQLLHDEQPFVDCEIDEYTRLLILINGVLLAHIRNQNAKYYDCCVRVRYLIPAFLYERRQRYNATQLPLLLTQIRDIIALTHKTFNIIKYLEEHHEQFRNYPTIINYEDENSI